MKKTVLLLWLVIFLIGCGDAFRPFIGEEVTMDNALSLPVKITFLGKEIARLNPSESDVTYQTEGDVLTGVVLRDGEVVGKLRPFTVPYWSYTHKHLWYINSYDSLR